MKAVDKQENPEYSDFKYIRSDIIYDIFHILQIFYKFHNTIFHVYGEIHFRVIYY